ncbi:MAG: arginase family protein [Bacillota bacterium]
MTHLNLLLPQWQGAGRTKDLYYGALKIKEAYLLDHKFEEIRICESDSLIIENDILGYKEIVKQLKDATELINNIKPSTIFTVGGGCDVEVASVSYLNKKYNENLAVIWFDSHGDLNTPDSSPSKKFHGMPLRTLLGDSNQHIIEKCFSKLQPSQLILIGTRDLDFPEEEYIRENDIITFPVELIQKDMILDSIKKIGFDNVYMHIDLDVLDPIIFPSVTCPTSNGIDFEKLYDIVEHIKNNYSIVGLSLLKYPPKKGDSIDKLKSIIDLGISL